MKGREKGGDGLSVSERSVKVRGRKVRWVSCKRGRERMIGERIERGGNVRGEGAGMSEGSVKVCGNGVKWDSTERKGKSKKRA